MQAKRSNTDRGSTLVELLLLIGLTVALTGSGFAALREIRNTGSKWHARQAAGAIQRLWLLAVGSGYDGVLDVRESELRAELGQHEFLLYAAPPRVRLAPAQRLWVNRSGATRPATIHIRSDNEVVCTLTISLQGRVRTTCS